MRLLLTIGLLLGAWTLIGCNKGADDSATQVAAAAKGGPVTTAARDTAVPAGEQSVTSAEETTAVIARLAPEFGLQYDQAAGIITGPGFPAQGVAGSIIVEKVGKSLAGSGVITTEQREAAVRTVLKQLAAIGQASAGQPDGAPTDGTAATSDAGSASTGSSTGAAAPPTVNYHPQPEEMLSPAVVFGDWRSVREDRANATVEHNDDYYESIQFRYGENLAVFHMFRDGKLVSKTEFPFTYDPLTGTVTLYGPDKAPLQTLIASATHPDPYLLWVQREGSRTKTLYEKVGRGGEPVTLEDEIEGVRILKGDKAAEEYRRLKEKERREGSG